MVFNKMSSLAVPLFISAGIIWLIRMVKQYISLLKFLNQFPNKGIPLPFFGHALSFMYEDEYHYKYEFALKRYINRKRVVICVLSLPLTFKSFCFRDPEMRKLASCWGPYRHLELIHPETVEAMVTSNRNISKSFGYDFLKPWLKEGILITSGTVFVISYYVMLSLSYKNIKNLIHFKGKHGKIKGNC